MEDLSKWENGVTDSQTAEAQSDLYQNCLKGHAWRDTDFLCFASRASKNKLQLIAHRALHARYVDRRGSCSYATS